MGSKLAVREALKKGDFSGMKDMLHTEVYEMMKDFNVIDTFRGKYFFLSNLIWSSLSGSIKPF